MLNQSTIIGTRVVEGAVIATVNCQLVAGVRFDRADSHQPKHSGKRLQKRRLPALASAHRLAAMTARHASTAAPSYAAASPTGEAWRMRMPAGRPSMPGATPADLPSSAWATLVLARAV